jgi:hypothetical protein
LQARMGLMQGYRACKALLQYEAPLSGIGGR